MILCYQNDILTRHEAVQEAGCSGLPAVALSHELERLVAMVTRLVDGVATGSPQAGEAVPFAADPWHAVVDAGLVGIGIGEEAV